MLSRVADATYWASRYVERAENVARFIHVNLDLMLDSASSERHDWAPLVATTGDQAWFDEHYSDASPVNVTRFLGFDRTYPNSILSSMRAARENARTVREVISREMWEELNTLYLMVIDSSRRDGAPGEFGAFFDQVKIAGTHYAGVTDATLSHNEAWHFSRLGRMLERADKTSRILDVRSFMLMPELGPIEVGGVGHVLDHVGWTALLNSASALQMYRQVYHGVSPVSVAQFLILNAQFPRSIRHCVHRIQDSLHKITKTPVGSFNTEDERLVGQLRSRLDYAKIEEIMEFGLHEYLDELQTTLNSIGQELSNHFFTLSSA
jgi:uncharacterized alpha-E superfamily protein